MTTVMAKGWMAALFMTTMVAAQGQSFNLDLDEMVNDPQTGGGAPSSAFGAAANQSGFWNRIDAGGPNLTTLFGLDGSPTPCQILGTGGGGTYGGFNNPNLLGDFRLLMADGKNVGTPVQYHFTGMLPGHYSIYTYSGDASGTLADNLFVNVPGSSTPTQTITGPMPITQFISGLDYCTHELDLSGSSFEIDVSGNGPPNPEVHGFQIVHSPVPEPLSVSAFTLGLAAFAARGRRM